MLLLGRSRRLNRSDHSRLQCSNSCVSPNTFRVRVCVNGYRSNDLFKFSLLARAANVVRQRFWLKLHSCSHIDGLCCTIRFRLDMWL